MLSGKPFQLLQVATNAPKEYYFVKGPICSGKEYGAERARNVHSFSWVQRWYSSHSRHVCVQYDLLEKILVDLITIGKCFLTLAELEVTDNIGMKKEIASA